MFMLSQYQGRHPGAHAGPHQAQKTPRIVAVVPRLRYHDSAGWSSLVARWAHNPKVEGSNPSPATKLDISTLVPVCPPPLSPLPGASVFERDCFRGTQPGRLKNEQCA